MMTPSQALQLVDHAVAELSATRREHVQLQAAISVLAAVVRDAEASRVRPPEAAP